MNKNPNRPERMNEIISQVFNPNYKTDKQLREIRDREIIRGIFS